ncbi:hypothetical protein MNV84_02442 [Leishmania braziliensis]|nr:hypothetical protein MNV84_02442 [Leishmania braziliensis]
MPASRVHPGTMAMVVVVDVISPLAQKTISSSPTEASAVERLEIDVDVVPYTTTADMVLADVAVALQEKGLTMCISLQEAVLASGSVLPPLTWLQQAMGANDSSGSDRRQVSSTLSIECSYAVAVQHAQNSADSHQMLATAPPLRSSLVLHRGGDYILEDVERPLSQPTAVLSVVPRSMEVTSSIAGRAPAQAAPPITSFLDVLTGPPASENGAVEANGAPRAPYAPPPSPLPGGAPTTIASSVVSGGDLAPVSQHTTASVTVSKAITDVSRDVRSSMSSLALGSTAPPLLPPPPLPEKQPPVLVVALRHLQAQHAQVLAPDAQHHDGSPNASTSVAAPAEEQKHLQPTLSWAATEAAVQAEVECLQGERALTAKEEEGEASPAASRHANTSLDETAGGDTQSGGGRGRQDGETASGRFSQPQLRAQWLAAVGEEICAYQRETAVLRQATKKALQWRESSRQQLREEIARLEAEAAQRSAVLAERDVLRRRVGQLEAQVAAVKAAEVELLVTQRAAAVFPPVSAKDEHAGGDLRASSSSVKSPRQCVIAAAAKAALESFRDASTSEYSNFSEHSPPRPPEPTSPPPPQTCRSVPLVDVDGTGVSRSAHRWSGRRVPLLYGDTAAAPTASTEYPLREAQQRPSRSRSRFTIERSFLSSSLQAEVRAALTSDSESGSFVMDSLSDSAESAEAAGASGSGCGYAVTAVKGEAALQPPGAGVRRRRQRSTTTVSHIASGAASELLPASWMSVNAAAPPAAAAAVGATPFRTTIRTAPSSAHPVILSATSSHPYRGAQLRPLSSSFSCDGDSCDGGARQAFISSGASSDEAVEEPRRVTAALRRPSRDLQSHPSEGQRLREQVRGLHEEIERGDEDVTRQGVSLYRQPRRRMARTRTGASGASRSATAPHHGLMDRHFAPAALGDDVL